MIIYPKGKFLARGVRWCVDTNWDVFCGDIPCLDWSIWGPYLGSDGCKERVELLFDFVWTACKKGAGAEGFFELRGESVNGLGCWARGEGIESIWLWELERHNYLEPFGLIALTRQSCHILFRERITRACLPGPLSVESLELESLWWRLDRQAHEVPSLSFLVCQQSPSPRRRYIAKDEERKNWRVRSREYNI